MSDEERRIFSVNLANWLYFNGFKYETGLIVEDGKKKVYFVFEDKQEVAKLIREFRSRANQDEFLSRLHEFLGCYNRIWADIKRTLDK